MKNLISAIILFSILSCISGKKPAAEIAKQRIVFDSLSLYDSARARSIPIAIYKPYVSEKSKKIKTLIFSHGYGENKGGDYLRYSYLTEFLAAEGYSVLSIQHELPTDSLLPLTGIPQIVRRPFWERGADNIHFVIRQLKKICPEADAENITLIGHSNGGDMSALFPTKYPGLIQKLITLDNRRMPLPRTASPKVFSLRSSDLPADEGVLPEPEAEQKYGMRIIKLPATKHNDMSDQANEAQRKEIRDYVLKFLRE